MNDNGLTTTEFLWHKAVGTNRAIPVACMRQRQSAPALEAAADGAVVQSGQNESAQ